MKRPLAFFLLFLYGCGYGLPKSALVERGYRSIIIPTFEDKTVQMYEVGLQAQLTNAIIREFLNDGRLRVVQNPGEADLLLKGEIEAFEPEGLNVDRDDTPSVFLLYITADISLVDMKTQKPFYKEKFKGLSHYVVLGGRPRTEGVSEAVEDMAEKVVFKTMDEIW